MRGFRTIAYLFTCLLALTAFSVLPAGPAWAQAPSGPAFETTKVAEGVYSFRFFGHRNMFIVTDEGVIATDPINPQAARSMMQEIRKVTDKPIRYVVYSHSHWDHILGGKVFKEAGARFISHIGCVEHFRAHPHPELVMPDETFRHSYDLKLGGKTLELRYFGRNHGDCLIVMRLSQEKILFVVDIVVPRRVGFRILPDFYPDEWVRSLREIETLDFDRIIPGHGPPVAPASAMREQREYLEDLMAAVKEAMAKSPDPDKVREMVKLPKYETWSAYNQFLGLNIERIWAYYWMGW